MINRLFSGAQRAINKLFSSTQNPELIKAAEKLSKEALGSSWTPNWSKKANATQELRTRTQELMTALASPSIKGSFKALKAWRTAFQERVALLPESSKTNYIQLQRLFLEKQFVHYSDINSKVQKGVIALTQLPAYAKPALAATGIAAFSLLMRQAPRGEGVSVPPFAVSPILDLPVTPVPEPQPPVSTESMLGGVLVAAGVSALAFLFVKMRQQAPQATPAFQGAVTAPATRASLPYLELRGRQQHKREEEVNPQQLPPVTDQEGGSPQHLRGMFGEHELRDAAANSQVGSVLDKMEQDSDPLSEASSESASPLGQYPNAQKPGAFLGNTLSLEALSHKHFSRYPGTGGASN